MMSLQKYEDLKNFVTMATGILNALYVSVVYTWNWLPLANKGIKSETKQKKSKLSTESPSIRASVGF